MYTNCNDLNDTTCSQCINANIKGASSKCYWQASTGKCSAFQDSASFKQSCDEKETKNTCSSSKDCKKGGVCQYNKDYENPQKKCYYPCTSDKTCTDLGVGGSCQKSDSCFPGNNLCTSYCNVSDYTPQQKTLDDIRSQIENMNKDSGANEEKMLTNIQDLQKLEKYLISLLSNPNLSPEEKNEIATKIQNLTEMRLALYKNLIQIKQSYESQNVAADATLYDQKTSVDIMEDELNRLKNDLTSMDQENLNKLRMIEINNYYSKRYENHTSVLKKVLLFFLLFSLLYFVKGKGLLPDIVFTVLLYILVALCVYVVGRAFIDMWIRDNMNYDQYDWMFNPKMGPKGSIGQGATISNDLFSFGDLGLCPK